jgi:hypothetical protein
MDRHLRSRGTGDRAGDSFQGSLFILGFLLCVCTHSTARGRVVLCWAGGHAYPWGWEGGKGFTMVWLCEVYLYIYALIDRR